MGWKKLMYLIGCSDKIFLVPCWTTFNVFLSMVSSECPRKSSVVLRTSPFFKVFLNTTIGKHLENVITTIIKSSDSLDENPLPLNESYLAVSPLTLMLLSLLVIGSALWRWLKHKWNMFVRSFIGEYMWKNTYCILHTGFVRKTSV